MPRNLRVPLSSSDSLRVLTDLHSYVAPSEFEITENFSVPYFDGELYLICTNSTTITITHTNKPKDKSRLIVVRAGVGAVSVNGNGSDINGAPSLSLSTQYDAPVIQYFENLNAHILVGQ